MLTRLIPCAPRGVTADQESEEHQLAPGARGSKIIEAGVTFVSAKVQAKLEDHYFIGEQREAGFAVVVNVEHFNNNSRRRRGSDRDTQRMIDVFTYLDAKVMVHRDGTASEILGCLKEYAVRMDERYDFFACVLMSHGGRDYIEGSDSVRIELEDVFRLFNGENCKALAGKPKLFFVQSTQERSPHFAVGADVLVASSSIAGCYDHLDEIEGSNFISSIHDVFMKHSKRKDLWKMLKMVGPRMRDRRKKVYRGSRFDLVARLRRSKLFFKVTVKQKVSSSHN